MTTVGRPDRVGELFKELFRLSPAEREARLRGADDADRAEVEALISTYDALVTGGDDFLEALDTDRARSLLQDSGPASPSPSTIGRYRVLRRLARGGMGIVYLAHDPRLDRSVAVKLLPPFLSLDPDAIRGLEREARAASALDDPHIETVYEIGETDDGSVFIAMAYYDGETLRDRIRTGPMAVEEVIRLGIQLAEGIDAAHRAGVIHRDIKPENILITSSGVLKIVDFGVARLARDGLTTAGLSRGTAAYMSPEQTRGESLDGRTDVWSTGVVLHEMLAGKRPFPGEADALIHAIRHDPTPDLSSIRPDLPARLAGAVERCLEKDRERRLASGGDLATVLREVERGEDSGAARRWERKARPFVAVTAIVMLAIAGLGVANLLGGRREPGVDAVSDQTPAIAVLPFQVRGEDPGLWREGMVDLLSVALGGSVDLRAVDARTVLAGWRATVDESGEPDLPGALRVAFGTGARYAVVGSAVSVARELRLGARVYAVPGGEELASLEAHGSADSLFSLVDRLAIGILSATWQGAERPRRPVDLSVATTSSLPALKSFLEGESLLRQGRFGSAVSAYERAVAQDSTFGFAFFRLGLVYGWVGDGSRELASYARALRHASRLPTREVELLRAITTGTRTEVSTTIGLLTDVTRKYPDDPDAWYFLGDRYYHDGEQLLASREENERAFRKAAELDPGFAPAYVHLINNAFVYRPDSTRADSLIRVYGRLAPMSIVEQENRIAFDLAFGDSLRRAAAFGDLDTLPAGSRWTVAQSYLDHPRFWEIRGTVLEDVRRRAGPLESLQTTATFYLAENALSRGRVRDALASLRDPLVSPLAGAGVYRMVSATIPLPPGTLESVFALPAPGEPSAGLEGTLAWFYGGAFAADERRWEDHRRAIDRLSTAADRLTSIGDSANARFVRGAAMALVGKGLWIRGDAQQALPLLAEAQKMATWPVSVGREAINGTIRWWIGELLLGLNRSREAAPYFESFWNDPLAAERLGPIYERIGDPVRAREAYEMVSSAWRDADPELRPRMESAEAALRRLSTAHGS